MSQQQVATNHAAIRTLAAGMEAAAGHDIHDALAVAGRLAAELIANGYRKVELIPPRGSGGSDQARADALAATAAAVAAARDKTLTAPPTAMATQRQLTTLAIALSQDGIRERPDRLTWCGAMVGRELTSSTELTRNEAGRLIDHLTAPLPDEPPVEDADQKPADEPPVEDPTEPAFTDEQLDEPKDNGMPLTFEQMDPEPIDWPLTHQPGTTSRELLF
jgi:hypothetical protein